MPDINVRRRLLLAALGLPAAVAAQGPKEAPKDDPRDAPKAPPIASTRPVFVLNSLDATISQIDPATLTEARRIPTGKEPHHLYLTPDEKSLIVANAASNSLTFVDPANGQIQRVLGDILDPYHLRFSPDMQWFVTAANRLNHVDIYRWQPAEAQRPLSLVKRFDAPRTPSHLSIDSRSTVVYASLQDSDELLCIDLRTLQVRWKVAVGKLPADVYLTPDDKTLLIGMTGDRVVEAYDVTQPQPRLIKRIATGDGAHAFRSMGDGRHVLVSNRVANTISQIDHTALAVVSELPGPGGPDCMDLLRDGRTLLLSSRWARKLSIVDVPTRRVLHQVDVGRSPHGVWTLDHASRV
jgi:DNA-binding beta-propeller fold protein YncE